MSCAFSYQLHLRTGSKMECPKHLDIFQKNSIYSHFTIPLAVRIEEQQRQPWRKKKKKRERKHDERHSIPRASKTNPTGPFSQNLTEPIGTPTNRKRGSAPSHRYLPRKSNKNKLLSSFSLPSLIPPAASHRSIATSKSPQRKVRIKRASGWAAIACKNPSSSWDPTQAKKDNQIIDNINTDNHTHTQTKREREREGKITRSSVRPLLTKQHSRIPHDKREWSFTWKHKHGNTAITKHKKVYNKENKSLYVGNKKKTLPFKKHFWKKRKTTTWLMQRGIIQRKEDRIETHTRKNNTGLQKRSK